MMTMAEKTARKVAIQRLEAAADTRTIHALADLAAISSTPTIEALLALAPIATLADIKRLTRVLHAWIREEARRDNARGA